MYLMIALTKFITGEWSHMDVFILIECLKRSMILTCSWKYGQLVRVWTVLFEREPISIMETS